MAGNVKRERKQWQPAYITWKERQTNGSLFEKTELEKGKIS